MIDGLISALGFALGAISLWIPVRLLNRRERLPIRFWLPCSIFAILCFYGLSIGPACCLVQNGLLSAHAVSRFYEPCLYADFHSPKAVSSALSRYAALWNVESTLEGIRNEPYLRNYVVDDLTYRLENSQRVFYTAQELHNLVTTTIEPDSWDELGGPGIIRTNAARQSLDVFQTRRVHSNIMSYLRALRTRKKLAALRGHELDLQSLFRAVDKDAGIFPDGELRSDAVAIGNVRGGQFVLGNRVIEGVGELIEFLGREPRGSLRSGILLCELFHIPDDAKRADVCDQVQQICRSRDLDLFIKPTSIAWGSPDRRMRWAVRASDSVYSPD